MPKSKSMKLKACLLISAFLMINPTAWSDPLQAISQWQIPEADRHLPTAEAEKWLQITNDATVLEGASFDHAGNMLLTNVFRGQILKVGPQRRHAILFEDSQLEPSATSVADNGFIYVAAGHKDGSGGEIFRIDSDGHDRQIILSADKGYLPNDMIVDKQQGIYFTDARGNSGDLSGGVYYISPDRKTLSPVLTHLSGGNGIALSPDGHTLWVVEFSAGVLHRLVMKNATKIAPFGETVAYRFNSPAPDSMKADDEGNLYIALHGQGRIIVLNRNATPAGQITIPGRMKGEYLRTANLAIKPGSHEMYILSSSDAEHNAGAAIFKSMAIGNGIKN